MLTVVLRRMRLRWTAAVAAVAVTLVTVAHLSLVPSIGQDSALGLLAVEQRLRGRTSSITEVTLADPEDLSRDLRTPITWWETPRGVPPGLTVVAPGPQSAVYLLRRAGLSLGESVKTLALLAWLGGVYAWSLYFRRVTDNAEQASALVAAFALYRMSHVSAYTHLGGETLLWGVYPLAAWVNLKAAASPQQRVMPAAIAGALTLGCLAVKPSAAFLVAALALWWVLLRIKRAITSRQLLSFALGATGLLLIGSVLGLMPLHPLGASRNAGLCTNDPVAAIMWSAGGWLLGMSDIAAVLESAGRLLAPLAGLAAPTEFLWLSSRAIGALSLALAVLFAAWWMLLVRGATPLMTVDERWRAGWLATITIVVVAASLLIMQLRGACVSFEGRHQQYGAFLALPLVASMTFRHLRASVLPMRIAAIAGAVVLIALPAAYGAAALVEKVVFEMPRRLTTVGEDDVRRDWLPAHVDARLFHDAFDDIVEPDRVLVVRSAVRALAFPDRRHFLAWRDPAHRAPPSGVALLEVKGSDEGTEAFVPMLREWDARDAAADVRVLLSVRR